MRAWCVIPCTARVVRGVTLAVSRAVLCLCAWALVCVHRCCARAGLCLAISAKFPADRMDPEHMKIVLLVALEMLVP
eukprot:10282360-Alexandrium_andersonii.AAC.1